METRELRAHEAMPLERLEAEITELAGHLAAAECRWLLLIAEFDRRAGHETWGCRTCAHWLSWQCGLDMRAARERVRVARALEHLPAITEEFASGKLSYSKVRALTRVAEPANEAALAELAEHATAVQIERIVRAYRGVLSADEEVDAANAQHAARFLRYEWADDGSLTGSFRIPPEMGAIFVTACEAARKHLPTDDPVEDGPAGPPAEYVATNCDALVLMAETLLVHGPGGRTGGDRYQIVINADAAALTDDDTDGMCELDGGPALAPETVRRLACDASIVFMQRDDAAGVPIAVSEKHRSIPAATRRAVHARDNGCRFPGCGTRIFIDVHHIHHYVRGGSHKLGNLVKLCRHHHRLVHEGGWDARIDADGNVVAIRPNGNVLPRPRRARHVGDGCGIERQSCARGIAIDATTCIPRWYGDRLDLPDIISGLESLRE